MNAFKYMDSLKKNNSEDNKYVDLLMMELNIRLYHYGNNFINTHENIRFLDKLLFTIWYFKKYFSKFKVNRILDSSRKKILSSSYFNLNSKLEEVGFEVYSPQFMINSDRVLQSHKLSWKTYNMMKLLRFSTFKELLNVSTIKVIKDYVENLTQILSEQQFNALVVSNDETALSKTAIEAFRNLSKPSFIFLHGLPGIYNSTENNQTDYLIVWGEKIKDNFIEAGINPDKIYVSGHPYYIKKPSNISLRFSFDNILVTSKVIGGSQHSDIVRLADRGNNIYYLNSIKDILLKFGIKSVRFRPHPSENAKWFNEFIDTDFFKIDPTPLSESLKKSSLVIGPTSSLLIDTYFSEVNYLIYEPQFNGLCLDGAKPFPPFDGSDSRVPVAKNDTELYDLLCLKKSINTSFIDDYIKFPFDISFIDNLV